jgi:hypothetical protein
VNLERRRFLQLATLGVVAAIASPIYRRLNRYDGPVDHPQLIDVLGPARVQELGAHYRSATPSESTGDALRQALANSRSRPFFGRKLIADLIREDFSSGRTALVDGWVLSVTEARQAALFSLGA